MCTSCINGYTLPSGISAGMCIACMAPCLTCLNTPTYCTSCRSGFTKQGWKCKNKLNVGFKLVIGAPSVEHVLGIIDNLVAALLASMGQNANNVDLIAFTSMTRRTIVTNGRVGSESTSDT